MLKKITLGLLAVIGLLAAYLLLWPVPIDPVPWAAPVPPGYTGPHAANDKLKGLSLIALPAGESGPEHVALGPDGKLYAAVASARCCAWTPTAAALKCSPTPAAACWASCSTPPAG